MTGLDALIRRNTKLYFKDKGMFFTSLITPLILLVLYSTFLSSVYEEMFRGALEVPGVREVRVTPNVIDRPNRYDLLIVLTMDREALPAYDACDAHCLWKQRYGGLIEKKAIFDCD